MSFGAIFIPARNACLPNLVPEDQLLTANALIQATELASLIVGALLATLIIGVSSAAVAFVVDSGTFLISAFLLLFLRLPQRPPRARPAPGSGPKDQLRAFWAEFAEGLRYITNNRHLLQLMAITTLATLGLSATVLLSAAFFEQLINRPAKDLGLLQAAEGLGMALGALLISAYGSWERSRQIVSMTMIVLGAGILIFALAPRFGLVLVGALVVGVAVVSARTTLAAMTQALVSDSQRGRVESAMVTVIGIGSMGGLIMAGILGDYVSPQVVFAITGVVVLGSGIAAIFTLRGAEQILLDGNGGSSPHTH
jgi:predicted MFS family arabinose efflux permease